MRHTPGLKLLEDELLGFDTLTNKSNGKSPNRLDAMVWAMTELSKGMDINELLKLAMSHD